MVYLLCKTHTYPLTDTKEIRNVVICSNKNDCMLKCIALVHSKSVFMEFIQHHVSFTGEKKYIYITMKLHYRWYRGVDLAQHIEMESL